MGRFDFKTRTGQISTIIQTLPGFSDADAEDFFARVTTAGGTLTTIEQVAINELVLNLKSAGVWNSMKAIYPMVGASAAACAQNLKSSSFTSTFSGGVTFASTGITTNGTNGFMNTNFKPLTQSISQNSFAFGIYCRNNIVSAVAFGATEPNKNAYLTANSSFGLFSGNNDAEGLITPNWTNGTGLFVNSRTLSTGYSLSQNTTFKTRTSTSIGVTNLNLYLGAYNNTTNLATNFSAIEFAFNFISEGLTNSDILNLYSVVQLFQTSLSRQV